MSICSIEDIAAHTKAPFWFQLYVMRDRGFIERLIDRAKAAKCPVLVLTMDLQILGQRHKDIRNGLKAPPPITPKFLFEIATKPAWAFGMLGTKRRTFRNIAGHVTEAVDLASLSQWTATQFDLTLNWKDIAWIKKRFGGPVVVKGILDAEDARLAVENGADGIIVSNHGGRAEESFQSTIGALPEVVKAVKGRIPVLVDGGVRRGTDAYKALALGATAVGIGRPYCWGLAAFGEPGVAAVLSILQREFETIMRQAGATELKQIVSSTVATGPAFALR
jgi:L-lactate dehydrogenase (cytochrome)